jgi:hypothetical protein
MGRALRLPGFIDILFVDSAADIEPLANDPRIDRGFLPDGPLINRTMVKRVTGTLAVDGGRLPSITPRADRDREARQRALEAQLDPSTHDRIWDVETIRLLGDAIRGVPGSVPLEIAAQQAIGRLFVADYRGSQETWKAAYCLNQAVQTRNPLRSLFLRLSGRLRRSKDLLFRLVGGDRAGVHATGVAVHSLVRCFEGMRTLWQQHGARERLSADAAVARCLVAPKNVLRQASGQGATVSGTVRPGTLVVIELDKIHQKSPSAQTAFMAGTWSRCPAAQATPLLLKAVWQRASADADKEKRP